MGVGLEVGVQFIHAKRGLGISDSGKNDESFEC